MLPILIFQFHRGAFVFSKSFWLGRKLIMDKMASSVLVASEVLNIVENCSLFEKVVY